MYPSGLTDAQWGRLEPLLRQDRGSRHAGGRPRKHELRRVVDALLYVVKTGWSVASVARQFSAVEGRARAISSLARCRALERVGQELREEGRRGAGTQCDTNGGHYRFAIGQDDRKRGAARLRRGQEDQRAVSAILRNVHSLVFVEADGVLSGREQFWILEAFNFRGIAGF